MKIMKLFISIVFLFALLGTSLAKADEKFSIYVTNHSPFALLLSPETFGTMPITLTANLGVQPGAEAQYVGYAVTNSPSALMALIVSSTGVKDGYQPTLTYSFSDTRSSLKVMNSIFINNGKRYYVEALTYPDSTSLHSILVLAR